MRGLAAHLLSALLLGSFFNSAVGWGVLFLDLVGRHKRGGEGGEEGGGGEKNFALRGDLPGLGFGRVWVEVSLTGERDRGPSWTVLSCAWVECEEGSFATRVSRHSWVDFIASCLVCCLCQDI